MFKNKLTLSLIKRTLTFALLSGFVCQTVVTGQKRAAHSSRQTRAGAPLSVKVTPVGPPPEKLTAVTNTLQARSPLAKFLADARYRQLDFQLLNPEAKTGATVVLTQFRAIYFDYTHNRSLTVTGDLDNPDAAKVVVSQDQPLPSREEFAAAVAVARQDPTFAAGLANGNLLAEPAMPPVIYPEAGASVERTVNILLLRRDNTGGTPVEIIGVNMIRNSVVRWNEGAPPTSLANANSCGVPSAGQATTPFGTAGQYQFTITQNGVTLWEFLAIRPSISSGQAEHSGIEIQSVKYKGKLVLKRMHSPILNVNYEDNACGPYRDWQWEEGKFQANGNDVAPGVRDCGTEVATTILETGNDTGNFSGIAFYRQNDEVVLVTEMNAGWYRYLNEYRFASNGTIRPRYGFGATNNSCVCEEHFHHVYWRFDFDINSAENNVIRPSRREFSFGAPVTTETRLQRDPKQTRASWLIENTRTLNSYMIRSNGNDGTAADGTFGRGDLWFLTYKANEISDREAGVYTGVAANLNAFLAAPETLTGKDIVVWYAGHFDHADGHNSSNLTAAPNVLTGTHLLGPDLVPVRW